MELMVYVIFVISKIDKDRLDIPLKLNYALIVQKNQPDLHLTSREENQRLINKGYMFYDETVMKLNENE